MSRLKDKTNQVFGRLTVLGAGGYIHGKYGWNCLCQCGNVVLVSTSDLTTGNRSSCGCLRKEISAMKNYSHGLTDSAEYKIWCRMKSRCYQENDVSYENYGGRGIQVCADWLDSFENFYRDMGPRPTKHHSIDRKNNNEGYSPENCRWATKVEQARNRRVTKMVTYKGETISLMDFAEMSGLSYFILYRKLFVRKLPIDQVLKELNFTS